MLLKNIDVDEAELKALCERRHIVWLALFGSVIREDFTDASDVDMLVEFHPDNQVGLFELVDVQHELSELIHRKVDLNTKGCLSKYFRDEVLAEAETLYVAA